MSCFRYAGSSIPRAILFSNLIIIIMKKALLLAILTLSFNAFAQKNRPQSLSSDRDEAIHKMMAGRGLKTPLSLPGERSGQAKYNLKNAPDAVIQLSDSVYYWDYDTDNSGWKFNHKQTGFIYNANNDLIEYKDLIWDGSAWINSIKYIFTYDTHHYWISQTIQQWDGTSWQNMSLISCAYDANFNMTLDSWKFWNNDVWENSSQRTYSYDVNNNLISELFQSGNVSLWENTYLQTFSYDANNNLLSKIVQSWYMGAWVNGTQYIYSYDANNNTLSFLSQDWNDTEWVNSSLYTYDYNENNLMISLKRQGWIDGEWYNNVLYSLSYDGNENLITYLYQGWSWEDSSFVNSELDTYTYNASNEVVSDLFQTWDGSQWINSELYNFGYDINHNNTLSFSRYWNNIAWVKDNQYSASYDENNFLISEATKTYDADGITILYGDSTYYYFRTVMGINDPTSKDKNISIFPNPSTGSFTLSALSSINYIEVYDLNGDCIWSDYDLKRQTSKSIDLSASAKGIYFLKVKSGGVMHSRKIVIQ
jgi:hypothetical protein